MNLWDIWNMRLGEIPYGPVVFLVLLVIVIICWWYSDVYYWARKLLFKKMTRRERKEWALQTHLDLFQKIIDLLDDPSMSDSKWREYLPICRYSDTILKQVLPNTPHRQLEDIVRQIINGEPIKP